MLTFSEIEAKAKEVAAAVETHAVSIFHHGVADALQELQQVEAKAKSEALVVVKDATPEVQAAVQLALETVEKAVLAAIEARLA
jgi:hypothetical protein